MIANAANREFQALAARFLKAYFDSNPHFAARQGLHEYDGRVPDFRLASINAWLDSLKDFAARLQQIDVHRLDPQSTLDYHLLQMTIDHTLFDWQDLRSFARNPMFYGDALDVSSYILRDYAPLDRRLRALVAHLRSVPAIVEVARTNLEQSLPITFVTTSIEVYQGMVKFLDHDLPQAVATATDQRLLDEFRTVNRQAMDAVQALVTYLEHDLKSRAHADFAIGPERFHRMLWVGERVDVPLGDLLELGQAELARLQAEYTATVAHIAPGKNPGEVVRMLSREHPANGTLIPEAAGMIEDLRQFVIDHNLVTIPSDVRCMVAETPPFLRWAFAMLSSPGPLEQVATEAYYWVTPPEPDWSAEQKEEWLSKFDYHTLRVVGIHEAYPGHYVHTLHNRRAPSTISKLFGAYSFWEGWAHYTEQMMLEAGYGSGDHKLRIGYLNEAVLRACRYIVAMRMHTQGMTVDAATRFFVENAFMEELPARKEAERGTFDPGYLNYTLGKLLVLKLREDYKRQQDIHFSLRAFHDRLLSYGAPPVPLVRQMMFGDSTAIL